MIAAVLWICAAVTLSVFAVMLYSVATFEHKADEPTSHQGHKLTELLWFSIPIVIFLSAIVPVLSSLATQE